MAKDRALIEEFEIRVFHKVDPGPIEERIQDGQFAYSFRNITEKIWSPTGTDWRYAVRSVAETATIHTVGRYTLEELVPMADAVRAELTRMLREQINKVTQPMLGVVVSAVEIGRVKVSTSNLDALRRRGNEPADTKNPLSIPADLYEHVRQALLECGPFDDDRQLRAVFAHPLLGPWQNGLPQVDTRAGRVDGVLDYLRARKRGDTGEAALVLLLQVLIERTDPADECHSRLTELTDELRKAV